MMSKNSKSAKSEMFQKGFFSKSRPEADDVQVIRCRDCKYYDVGACFVESTSSDAFNFDRSGDDFCSRGERRKFKNDF